MVIKYNNPFVSVGLIYSVEYPRLFYGVCLGALPRERLHLPQEVIAHMGDVAFRRLEVLASQHSLKVFRGGEDLEIALTYPLDCIHVGEQIHRPGSDELKARHSPYEECQKFSLKQIMQLNNNPQPLLEKLKGVGIMAVKDDLHLYGYCVAD